MAKSDMVQSLLKALDILEAVGHSQDGMRLNEISEALGLKKPTAHNLLRTLSSRGYVVKDEANRYRLGAALEDMVRFRSDCAVMRRGASAVRELAEQACGAVVTFSELAGNEICCRWRIAPDCPGVVRQPPSQTFSPFGSASGLCLQAFNADFREAMSRPCVFEESGQRLWKTRAEFDAELARAARLGMAVVAGDGFWRLAAPVGERMVLGLSAAMTDAEASRLSATMKTLAARIDQGDALAME